MLRRRPRRAHSRTADADADGRASLAAARQCGWLPIGWRLRPESRRVSCQGATQSRVTNEGLGALFVYKLHASLRTAKTLQIRHEAFPKCKQQNLRDKGWS